MIQRTTRHSMIRFVDITRVSDSQTLRAPISERCCSHALRTSKGLLLALSRLMASCPSMAYIKMIDRESAVGELQRAFDEVAGARGTVANILGIHSLHPRVMLAHLALYRELMFGRSELTRPEREMIAVAVSAANHCHY